jgi:putative hydrolase of the HAD superfamily
MLVMNNKYTHIFFDLDNTLWDFERNSRNAMFEAFHRFQLDGLCDFNLFFETYTKHNHALWQSYRNNEVVKKELIRLRFQNTFTELELNGIDAVEMNTLYLHEMPKQKVLNEGVTDILIYLKRKRYHINIITNGFKEVQREKIETSGLKPFFDKIFISEEVKSPKPERAIFEYAIKSANAKKTSCIMVGDDWETDVLGAVNYGIDAVHYQNNPEQNLTKVTNPYNTHCEIFKMGLLSNLSLIL